MHTCLLVILLFVLNCALGAEEEQFYCNHGESINNVSSSVVAVKCPSQRCIRFGAVCNNYWALACYNENDPMFLFKNFSMAQKLYKKDPESATFDYCTTSKCNAFNNTDIFNTYSINKPAQSFDRLLTTKIPKEKIYRELQNKVYSYDTLAENRTLKVIFNTSITSKQAFVSLDLNLKDTSTVRRKFIFDFVNGKVKLTKWIQLSNSTKPGGKLYFSVETTMQGIRIFINNQFLQSLDKKVLELSYMTYGGEMNFHNSSFTIDGVENTLWGFDPDFHRILISLPNPKSTKINATGVTVTNVNWEYDTSYLMYPITPLKNYEKLSFEFRTDYKPNTDLVKIQIQVVPFNSTSDEFNYHIFIWSRINNNWSSNGKRIVKNCKKPNLFMTWGLISFYCDNSSKHSLTLYDVHTNSKFLYRNAKVQKFTC